MSNDDSAISRLEVEFKDLTIKLGLVADGQIQMIGRLDHYLKDAERRDREQLKRDDLSRQERIKMDDRVKDLENYKPLVEAHIDKTNKITTGIAGGVILLAIVGGIIGRYT